MKRFICCCSIQTALPPGLGTEVQSVPIRLKTVSNNHSMDYFPATPTGTRSSDSADADKVEWSPSMARSLGCGPGNEINYPFNEGELKEIRTNPWVNTGPARRVPPQKAVGRSLSFNASAGKSSETGTLMPLYSQALVSPRQKKQRYAKRTVSFNLPAEKPIQALRDPAIPFKSLVHGQNLLCKLRRYCTNSFVEELMGSDNNKGELAEYEPLMQLMILKVIFSRINIDDPFFFKRFFRQCLQFASQWDEYSNEGFQRDDKIFSRIDFDSWLEISRANQPIVRFQLQGEMWLKFFRELFRKLPRKAYIIICRQFFNTLFSFWHEYQIEIIRIMLRDFGYIPREDIEEIFLFLARLCEQRSNLGCYEHIRLLASNIKHLDEALRYPQMLVIQKLAMRYGETEQAIIYAELKDIQRYPIAH